MATKVSEANALSGFAQVLRPGVEPAPAKRKKVVRKKKRESKVVRPTVAAKIKESIAKLREYMPIAPKGSWEKTSELVLQAARRAPEFGAFEGESSWSISIWASYPDKNAVVIGNTNSGQLWAATYQVDAAGLVTFPTVIKAEQTFTAVTESNRSKPGTKRLRESAGVTKLHESFKLNARIREVKIDDKGGIAAECVMLEEGPGNEVDGHYYTAECIIEAAQSGVFEGAHSFADHADEVEERIRPERSIRDMIGWWSDVHAQESNGKQLLIGTYNIETGNDFALNKMREAKRYAEKYKDNPSKQYVGFSIFAGGKSETQEIDGKTYDAVLQITEAGSTDMVTRAGAGGKMLTLKEAQRMGADSITPEREKKFLESLISGISKNLNKKLGKTVRETARSQSSKVTVLSEAAFNKALEEAGVEMDDDDKGAMHAALAKALDPKSKKKSATSDDMDAESDDMDEADSATGDASLDDILEPDDEDEDDSDDDEDDDDNDIGDGDNVKLNKIGESDAKKLPPEVVSALKERDQLKARETMRARVDVARAIIREKNVPKAAHKYLLTELAQCKTKKQMRERADAIIEAIIRPTFGDGVVGNPASARVRESGGGTGNLLTVSGIEK